ncbi:hypothetical protein [Sphaerothrix gracilis]|uniref:hypothetical protein n=1 Tax=Sphaerothrix gracilis TaxID=3151835 RepID=UPI0031FCAAE6
MTSSTSRSRSFNGMDYRSVQRTNTQRKNQLAKAEQAELKQKGYKNVGWDNVIKLYRRLELLLAAKEDEPSLEDLFLQADRIGHKYQTAEEIQTFNQQLTQAVNTIADTVDRQFPEEDTEMIDYRPRSRSAVKKNSGLKKRR